MTIIKTDHTTVENLIAFAGYSVTSQTKYLYNDQVSVARHQSTDTSDFCGAKELAFTLNATDSTWLKANNPDFIHFSPSADSKDFGVGLATVQAAMKDYTLIYGPIFSFTATILGSIAPTIAN